MRFVVVHPQSGWVCKECAVPTRKKAETFFCVFFFLRPKRTHQPLLLQSLVPVEQETLDEMTLNLLLL